MIEAGMDVARFNFSHGTHEKHKRRLELVREAAREVGRSVPIMQDLQGPKIRVGDMAGGGVLIHKGQILVLTSEPLDVGDANRVHISYKDLAAAVAVGGKVLLDDGLLELEIVDIRGDDVYTEVTVGGPLRSRKGVHFPRMVNSRPSLTKKDISDLKFGLEMGVDIVALSFVRNESDVRDLVKLIREEGKDVSVVAKIEKPEAVDVIDEILELSDAVMVARGDLGIEMPLSRVPGLQKEMIIKCLRAATPVITATQMLESMVDNPRPTRAEASDVANAVLDGSDAVMLSAETAVGKYPVRVVEVMAEIIEDAEKHYSNDPMILDHRPKGSDEDELITESVSYMAYQLAEHTAAKAIVCLTASGATARSIARHRPSVPLYAFTDTAAVVNQLGLLWGTNAFLIPFQSQTDEGISLVNSILKDSGLLEAGDRVVMTAGMPLPAKGSTNMVLVSQI